MACSVAIVGGGSNKEYALHILHKANGNVKVGRKHNSNLPHMYVATGIATINGFVSFFFPLEKNACHKVVCSLEPVDEYHRFF